MGAMNIVNYLQQHSSNSIKATVLMDPGNIFNFSPQNKNYPITIKHIPTMLLWSSYFKTSQSGSMYINQNDYEICLSGSKFESDFSNHENFSDISTYQYHKAFQIKKLHDGLTNPKNSIVGNGNGYEIAQTINNYILPFFDYYLNGKKSKIFDNCQAISNQSQIKCKE